MESREQARGTAGGKGGGGGGGGGEGDQQLPESGSLVSEKERQPCGLLILLCLKHFPGSLQASCHASLGLCFPSHQGGGWVLGRNEKD